MNPSAPRHLTLLSAAIGAVLVFGGVSQANAQTAHDRAEARRERHAQSGSEKASESADQYPDATREAPKTKASSKMTPRLKKMMDAYDDDNGAEARTIAEEIMASDKANEYDKSFAAQIAAQTLYDEDDSVGAIADLQKALDYNGLDNNAHYGAMLMMAQLQLQEEQYDAALSTIDRFFAETKSTKPEHLVVKGNALYRMERYPEAATVLKQAIDASPEPRNDWQQMLMATYFETGQTAEANALAESIASRNPGDKRAQMNLAATYQQGEQLDKAAEVLEKLRASGQLTEDREYRQLYSVYLNMDGHEADAAKVIQEGLSKGILQDDFQNNLALAQSLYFSEQIAPAIAAYAKAAPLDDDGETYLNLARIYWQEDRIPEAKEAARQALAKGVKNPEDAKKITAL
ncbi:tetratricopeptide repeat protein [Marilutibacter spongiae]|uniref:Tetratricopeptide repeat protein n=1 Tax=Marilutibacter spongiae TaxID=2025720 RepID=A0A7W3Y7H7_9GAMM|nr:tetratricopeptide repeat protein [Lysobacter spongiae]MBB1061966.1 tetratricopeptide repeat protein [Lysobacter spongiae]